MRAIPDVMRYWIWQDDMIVCNFNEDKQHLQHQKLIGMLSTVLMLQRSQSAAAVKINLAPISRFPRSMIQWLEPLVAASLSS